MCSETAQLQRTNKNRKTRRNTYTLRPGVELSKVTPVDALYQRLDLFHEHTGVKPESIDVVIGIYSGGAFLAPFAGKRLNRPVCFIRASRYKSLNLSFLELGTVAILRALRLHDSLYKVSNHPDVSLIRGKNVLMIDDASVTGGTFRAVASWCKTAGAKEVRGVALAGTKNSRIWDPQLRKKPVQQQDINLAVFSPWGTF